MQLLMRPVRLVTGQDMKHLCAILLASLASASSISTFTA